MLRSRTICYEPAENNPMKIKKNSGAERVLPGLNGESHRHSIPAIRCFRCGESFPVTDFISTKKSGLCIPCWERKIPGAADKGGEEITGGFP